MMACRGDPYRQVPAATERHISIAVPALVDEDLFASVAERLEENRRRHRERLAGVQYLLRGLLVCQKCGYGFTGQQSSGPWSYYRCCGTDRTRFHGARRCDARLVAVDRLDEAVWREVCRLLDDPTLVIEEYQRRLDAVQASPHRHELDALGCQLAKARRAIERLIDSYTEGLINKPEFEPRLAELRRRTTRLETDAKAQQEADEQIRSLHLVIGRLDLFAAMVRDRLECADWVTKRDIICTLVKRIEVADNVVRVIFRIDPGSSGPSETRRTLHHCLARHPAVALCRNGNHSSRCDCEALNLLSCWRWSVSARCLRGVRPPSSPGWTNAAKKNGRAHLGARSRRMRDYGQGLSPTGYKVMRTNGSHERHRARPRISRQHLLPALD
jgi:site-specific DNA recombinase